MLFFANKRDINGAMGSAEVAKMLQLEQIGERPWHIESSCGLSGDGLDAGLKWLAKKIM